MQFKKVTYYFIIKKLEIYLNFLLFHRICGVRELAPEAGCLEQPGPSAACQIR